MKNANHMITEEEALARVARLCAKKEYASLDVKRKLLRMGLSEESAERVVSRLKRDQFIDEHRYANGFIHDKLRFNKWGRRKIEHALRQKQLPPEVIAEAFTRFSEAALTESLLPMLEKKSSTVKGRSPYEKRGKLIQYALGRGFSMDDILACLKRMNLDLYPDETE